ncbi:MAG TPA: hypothetical protein ENK31_07015, partial [Nannocystis exedens]|nr:hypothetical protein [Nannocystis exedens]
MHVARRLLVLVPVLLGLGCTKDNFFYVTESDSSPASGSDSDTNEDDCVEETTTIKIEDAFFVKNHGGGACPIRDTGKPCASLNWGKTGGLRLDNNGEITSAYVIRPKAPLENLVSGPEKIMNAKLQVMFYRDNDGKVADSQDFILARIAEGNLWDEGDEDGFLPEGEGSTYDYLSPLKMNEWIGQNGPIGTAESNTR